MKMNNKENSIGDAIKEAIIFHNMTQREVAKAIHVSPQTLSNFIHNHRTPNTYDLIAIADFLRMDIHELLGLSKGSHDIMDYMIYENAKKLDRNDKRLILSFMERLLEKKDEIHEESLPTP